MVYTPEEAAGILGVCKTTVLRMIRRGEIRAYKLSARTIRIDQKEIDALKEKCMTGSREKLA